jgi:hypothetical protein
MNGVVVKMVGSKLVVEVEGSLTTLTGWRSSAWGRC